MPDFKPTALMNDVAREIIAARAAGRLSFPGYFYVDERTYALLDRDVTRWCKTDGRLSYAYEGSYPDGGYVPNFLFTGAFVTCVPSDQWPSTSP